MEYDNPACVLIRNGKVMPIPYNVRDIEGKTIVREFRFNVALDDYFVLFSDGVVHAGVGNMLSFRLGKAPGSRVYSACL